MKQSKTYFGMNRLGVYFLLIIFAFTTQFCARDASTQLFDLYEQSEEFEEELREEGDDDEFSVRTQEELEEEYEFWSGINEELEEIDREVLSDDDQISYDIFKRDVLREIKDYEFRDYVFRINHEGGFHTRLVGGASRMSADSLEDFENYIARLHTMPEYFEQNMAFMREGIETGLTLPKAVMVEEYKQTITSQIVDRPEESSFYQPFEEFPDFVSEADQERLREEARAAIKEAVVPSYEKFLEFMEQEYIPNAREEVGYSNLTNGEEYYQYLTKYYTTLDITPEEVHEIGLDEVERIRAEMEAIIDEVDFQGDFDEFLNFLRTDSQFYVDEPEELMEEAAHIAKKMDGKLPELFNMLPREPYGIEPVPDHLAPRYTGGRYSPGRGDTEAGYYWVNTYDLPSRPLYTLESLTYHEAVPGHHLQIALANELEDLSEIRQESGTTAFVEGWALYSERLGLEAGFYQDPYSNFGRLTYEMWRACRLVVDTGMHVLGWSRQKAVDFMTENTALSHHEIDTEINRYIAGPAQALAYKMGELKIRELREEAEEKLGSDFNIREFHDAVLLGGPVPLPALEDQIQEYINENIENGSTES
jgi:uncharacterized protein (DUF885 family)